MESSGLRAPPTDPGPRGLPRLLAQLRSSQSARASDACAWFGGGAWQLRGTGVLWLLRRLVDSLLVWSLTRPVVGRTKGNVGVAEIDGVGRLQGARG